MSFDRDRRSGAGDDDAESVAGAPGKKTRVAATSVQRKVAVDAKTQRAPAAAAATASPAAAPAEDPFALHLLGNVQQAAQHGTSDAGGELPHAATIQRAFGKHDISGISSHTGAAATEATAAMGAKAYASGSDVAF